MLNANNAPLAYVAYAQVVGADGTSPNLNSGVTTARLSTGSYTVTLPSNPAGQSLGLGSSPGDLIFVQPIADSPVAFAAVEDDTNQLVKHIYLGIPGTTAVDCDFNVLICRSMLTPVLINNVPQPV